MQTTRRLIIISSTSVLSCQFVLSHLEIVSQEQYLTVFVLLVLNLIGNLAFIVFHVVKGRVN